MHLNIAHLQMKFPKLGGGLDPLDDLQEVLIRQILTAHVGTSPPSAAHWTPYVYLGQGLRAHYNVKIAGVLVLRTATAQGCLPLPVWQGGWSPAHLAVRSTQFGGGGAWFARLVCYV